MPVLHRLHGGLPAGAIALHAGPPPGDPAARGPAFDGQALKLAEALEEKSRRLFGRSLKLRQVSAGGLQCLRGGFECVGHGRLRHGPLRHPVRGLAAACRRPRRHRPVSENMRTALLDTYAAVPAPKLVIAVGALRDQRRSLHRPSRGPQRLRRAGAGRSLHPRLSAAPDHDPGRALAAAGQAGVNNFGS